ncbi:hypothetical protein NC651_026150 [Populus alba x Populus x berolinensis]|nr:hypothetical protein NC651_026150 [Populus alba x Populus x berolinensis]
MNKKKGRWWMGIILGVEREREREREKRRDLCRVTLITVPPSKPPFYTTKRLEADFFRGWFLIFPRFDRSYFFLSQLWLSLCLSLSLSFFFFASNGSGSARKEGGRDLSFHWEDQKLTRSSLIFQRKSVQSFLADRDSYLACQVAPNPLTNI